MIHSYVCSEPTKQSMQAVIEEEENLAAIQEREQAIKSLEVCFSIHQSMG